MGRPASSAPNRNLLPRKASFPSVPHSFLAPGPLGNAHSRQVEFGAARVEEFLPGDNLSADSMREPAIAAAIARAMAAFHIQMLAAVQRKDGAAGSAAGSAAGGQQAQQAPHGAIWGRIRKWHAAAAEVAPAELEALGLAGALEEVRARFMVIRRLGGVWGWQLASGWHKAPVGWLAGWLAGFVWAGGQRGGAGAVLGGWGQLGSACAVRGKLHWPGSPTPGLHAAAPKAP